MQGLGPLLAGLNLVPGHHSSLAQVRPRCPGSDVMLAVALIAAEASLHGAALLPVSSVGHQAARPSYSMVSRLEECCRLASESLSLLPELPESIGWSTARPAGNL